MVSRLASSVARAAGLALVLALPGASPARAVPAAAPAPEPPPPGTLFIEARRVITVTGATLEPGRIIVRDGRIEAVGKDLARPAFSRLVDARDLTVTPGFVLAATEIGMPAEPPAPSQDGVRVEVRPDAKAADELVPGRLEHALLLEAGITTAGLLPLGDAAGLPGQISAISTRPPAPGASDPVLSAEAALVCLAATHAQWRKAVGEAFDKARHERDAHAKVVLKKGEDGGEGPKGVLSKVVTKQRPLIIFEEGLPGWVALQDTLPLGELDAWVVDGADLWTAAQSLKDLGVKVLTFPVLGRERDTRLPVNRAARWKAAGVRFAFVLASDDVESGMRLRDHVIDMVRTGVPPDAALAALTSEPAAALGLSEKAGSIAAGRRADLLFWTGDPLDPLSRLDRVMAGGVVIERRARAGLADAASARTGDMPREAR